MSSDEYTPTVEEVRDAWWRDQNTPGDLDLDDRHNAAFDRFIAVVERAAAVKALREAAFTGYFGTSAQNNLMRLAERREADRIEGGESA